MDPQAAANQINQNEEKSRAKKEEIVDIKKPKSLVMGFLVFLVISGYWLVYYVTIKSCINTEDIVAQLKWSGIEAAGTTKRFRCGLRGDNTCIPKLYISSTYIKNSDRTY
jgi:hypothetical protein